MKSFLSFIFEEYSYSSVQLILPDIVANEIISFGRSIPNEEVYKLEGNPHITIKYGLITTDPNVIKSISLPKLIVIEMGNTSLFSNEKGDVLKIDIISDDLINLNKEITKNIPNIQTYPEYIPHATIGYLNPGYGKKYLGDDRFNGIRLEFDEVEFSGSNDLKTRIKL